MRMVVDERDGGRDGMINEETRVCGVRRLAGRWDGLSSTNGVEPTCI